MTGAGTAFVLNLPGSLFVTSAGLGLALLLGGCGGTGHQGVDGAFDGLPVVETAEVLRLGGLTAEGAAAIGSIAGAILLDEAGVLVFQDGHSQEIHVFNLDGVHTGTFAGRGVAPGESLAGRGLGASGTGGICLWDAQLSRLTRFSLDGSVLSTATLEGGHLGISRELTGFTADCGAVMASRRLDQATRRLQGGALGDSLSFVYFGPDGAHVRDMEVVPERDLEWRRFPDGNGAPVRHVLGATTEAFVAMGMLWVGRTDALAWDRIYLDGDRVGSWDIPHAHRAPSPEEVRLERERRMDEDPIPGLGGPTADAYREAYRSAILEVPVSPRVPMYEDVLVSADDSGIWIRTPPLAGSEDVRWWLLCPQHGMVGQLFLPQGGELIAALEDLLLVRSRDAFDVTVLEVHRWSLPNAIARCGEGG